MKKLVVVFIILIALVLSGCEKSKIEEDFKNLESFYKENYSVINDEFVLLDKTLNGYDIEWNMSRTDVYDPLTSSVFSNLPNGGLDDCGLPLFVTFTASYKNISISFGKMIDAKYLSEDAKDVLSTIKSITSKIATVESYYKQENKYLLTEEKFTGVEFTSNSKYIEVDNGTLVANISKIDEDTLLSGYVRCDISFSVTKGDVTCHPTSAVRLFFSNYSSFKNKTISELKELSGDVSAKVSGHILYMDKDYIIFMDEEENQILIKTDLALDKAYRYELEVTKIEEVNGIKHLVVTRVLNSNLAYYESTAYSLPNVLTTELGNSEAFVCVLKEVNVQNSKYYSLTSEIVFYNEDGSLLKSGNYKNLYGAYIPLDETHSKFIVLK